MNSNKFHLKNSPIIILMNLDYLSEKKREEVINTLQSCNKYYFGDFNENKYIKVFVDFVKKKNNEGEYNNACEFRIKREFKNYKLKIEGDDYIINISLYYDGDIINLKKLRAVIKFKDNSSITKKVKVSNFNNTIDLYDGDYEYLCLFPFMFTPPYYRINLTKKQFEKTIESITIYKNFILLDQKPRKILADKIFKNK